MRLAARAAVAAVGTIGTHLMPSSLAMNSPLEAVTATPTRRFLDRNPHSPTLISTGSHFEGQLQCGGDLAVAGTVVGTGHIGGMLSIAETGSWRGDLQCVQALIAGQLHGQLLVTGKLEIRSSARLSGQISAQHIAIAEGAIVEAELTVLSGAEVQRFMEQRSG
jgi:cytoskeletal protein CcmA (bactofilin family)